MINVFALLKSTTKEDLKPIAGPILALILFFIIGVFLFPKPSKIYREGVLRSCSCLGIKAAPRTTKGSLVGDEYCLGIPFRCERQDLLKQLKEQGKLYE